MNQAREIRFRAWDGNKMYYDALGARQMPAQTVGGIHLPPYYSPYFASVSMLHLMQFTGLTDKNGVPIYEGDLLSGHDAGTAEVRWGQVGWRCFFSDDTSIGLHDEMCIWYGNNLEVIGNIYEHSYLLK